MQDAKDTFYEVMRARLAALNPERTVVVCGVVRPALVVEENELVSAVTMPDCFRLRWTQVALDTAGALTAVQMRCEIRYETAGSAAAAGMDRGRCLAAMDTELQSMVNATPQNAVKTKYAALAQSGAAVELGTNVWWGEAELGAVEVRGDRVGRFATVAVMGYLG